MAGQGQSAPGQGAAHDAEPARRDSAPTVIVDPAATLRGGNAQRHIPVGLGMGSFPLRVMLAAVVAIAAVSVVSWAPSGTPVPPSAKALEAALLAPCCWNGTLATHDSPLASELREEIEARAGRGESTVAIEADLVTRHGSRIRALPHLGAFTNALVLALDLLIAAIAALAITLWRWRRPLRTETESALAPNGRQPRARYDGYDGYDARIDAELARLDEGR